MGQERAEAKVEDRSPPKKSRHRGHHRFAVDLPDEFWQELKEEAKQRRMSVSALAREKLLSAGFSEEFEPKEVALLLLDTLPTSATVGIEFTKTPASEYTLVIKVTGKDE